jgi:hypothetical protein
MQFDPEILLKNKKEDIYGNEQGATFEVIINLSMASQYKKCLQKINHMDLFIIHFLIVKFQLKFNFYFFDYNYG